MTPTRTTVFAASLGVGKSTISQAMQGPLRDAKIGRGLIDLDHPSVAEYVEATRLRKERYEAGTKPRGRKKEGTSKDPKPPPPEPQEKGGAASTVDPTGVKSISQMTMAAVIEKYGTASRLKEYVAASRIIEQTRKLQIEIAEKENRLVDRAIVEGMIGALDGSHIKLLTDGAKTISRRASQKVLAGETPEQIEVFVRETLGKYLRVALVRIVETLEKVGPVK